MSYIVSYLAKDYGTAKRGWYASIDPKIPLTYPIDEKCVMQFTGIIDKNGKEIYEGDIIRFGSPVISTTIGKVELNVFGVIVVNFDNGGYHLLKREADDEGVEIIGNIYENPELY